MRRWGYKFVLAVIYCGLMLVGGCMVGPKYKKAPVVFDANDPWTYAPAAYLDNGDVNSIEPCWKS